MREMIGVMDKEDGARVLKINDWVLRARLPSGDGYFPLVLMLHGWTGDERAMWVFAPRLPAEAVLLAPRGPYPAPMGGYSWHRPKSVGWPEIEDFRPAVNGLQELLERLNLPQANVSRLHLVGFSQGAALGYAFALLKPGRLASLAALSGFLPQGASALARKGLLNGLPVYITHGAKDELVPVVWARQAAEVLEQAGAQISYCEDDVGHKLSAACFRGLEAFYQNLR